MNERPGASATATSTGGRVDPPLRIQILAAEHWSLLATRSLTWNEMFTRAAMFITVLSASLVAIALVAQATSFATDARWFALLVLPVVDVLGLLTFIRLGEANTDDIGLVAAMNRLRRGYLEVAPELEPFFTTSSHDDMTGILRSYGVGFRRGPVRFLAGTPALVGIVNVALTGAITALAVAVISTSPAWLAAAGLVGAGAMASIEGAMVRRAVAAGRRSARPRFPTPVDKASTMSEEGEQ